MKRGDLPAHVRAKVPRAPRRAKSAAEKAAAAAQAARRDGEFRLALRKAGIPEPVAEHRFHPVRRHRLDYAWPAVRLGLEVDGGIYTAGKHGRGAGIELDQFKTNLAAALGWRVMRTTPRNLTSPGLLALLRRAMEA